MGVFVKAAGTWTEIAASKALINWAKVSGGTVTTYTDAAGAVMEVHTFTGNGSLEVLEPGYAEVLVCGAGMYASGTAHPQPGQVRTGLHALPSGTTAVTVGQPVGNDEIPGSSSLGTVLGVPMGTYTINADSMRGQGGVSMGTDKLIGLTSKITGTAVAYGRADGGTGPGATSRTNPGGSGTVIVAVQQTPPTVSGVAASGGAENDYTGDGTNGVLGQRYRVHRFTANGTLSVSQGGTIKYLVVGAGGGSNSPYTGNGGDVKDGSMAIVPGAMPVVVGLGGVDTNATGGPSSLGSILTSIATFCPSDVRATGAGGTVAAPNTGLTSRITGTAVEYARAGMESPPVNSGSGRHPNAGILPGASGCVIVRYEIGG